MQILHLLSTLVLGLLVSAQQSPPKELDIKTTHTPPDCTAKANKGDAIKVHYVRRKPPAHLPGLCGCILTKFLTNCVSPIDRKIIFQWQQI